MISSNDYDIDGIQKIKTKLNSFTLLCLNTCSLNKNFGTRKYFVKTANQKFYK